MHTSSFVATSFDVIDARSPMGHAVASDVMHRLLLVAHPHESLGSAAHKLLEGAVRHLPVVDDVGRVVGILSDRDIRNVVGDPTRALARKQADTNMENEVGAIMTRDPICVRPDARFADIAQLFVDERIGAVLVVTGDGTLAGIISYVDVIAHLLRMYGSAR